MTRAVSHLGLSLLAAVVVGCSLGGASPPGAAASDGRAHRSVHGQILVTVQASGPWAAVASELRTEYGLEILASWPMEALGVRCVLFQVLGVQPAASVVRSLEAHPRVELAQLNQVFTVLDGTAQPDGYDDPHAGLQYAPQRLGLVGAHGWSTGQGVDVAVVDTGVDVTHPELAPSVSVARNFVRQDQDEFTGDRHGTAVAGVIAAAAGNGEGIVGVAPGVRLRALKACWYADRQSPLAMCTSYTLAQALDYSVSEGVDILNLSLGGPRDPLLERLIRVALERGILVVTAAGETADSFPGTLAGVLSVRACDAAGNLWRQADGERGTTGAAAGLVAPGVEILTLAPRGSYDFLSGTSLAAAHVTGVAALLLARRPDLETGEIARLLVETSAPGGGSHAIVHACAALGRLLDRDCPG